ncbi:MAG TPA: cell division protein FtsZ [Candidatus Paceibacterota bacterium]
MKKSKRKTKKQVGEFSSSPIARIKVVGLGGGGGNAVSRMSKDFTRGVEFIAINTDHQDLDYCDVRKKIYIGKNLTRGLGTGMNPELGRQAAEENRSEIAEAVKDADIVFITAGLGGGTGTGVSPIVAEAAKQAGALTLAFVTKPFVFEGTQRQRIAEDGILKLKDKVDALIVVPNDRIFTIINKDTSVLKAFEAIDDVMKTALRGLVEFIVTPGIINVDFADVRTIIQDAGSAIVGIGVASGQERAVNAVNQALNSPLLEVNPEGAQGVLLGISGGRDLKMTEINDAAKIVAQTVGPGAKIIFGAYYDKHLRPGQLKITLIATGFQQSSQNNSLFSPGFGPDGKQPFLTVSKASAYQTFEDLKQKATEEKAEASERVSTKANPGEEQAEPKSDKNKQLPVKKTDSDVWDIPTFLRRKKK